MCGDPYNICLLIWVAKLETSHVLQSNKNKSYRGRSDRLSVSIAVPMSCSLGRKVLQYWSQAYGVVLFFEYLFYHIMLVASLYMSIASLINGVRSQSVPWWFIGYTSLVVHHLLRLYQLAAAGELLNEEVKHVLTMLSQFGFLHGDLQMICLTIARRPTESLLSLAGWAALRRSLVGKTLAFVLVTMLLIANYKLNEWTDLLKPILTLRLVYLFDNVALYHMKNQLTFYGFLKFRQIL